MSSNVGHVVGVVCVRMDSARLPGKILAPIGGKPLLQHVIERLDACQELDAVVIATTTDASDDPVAALCARLSAECYRGSPFDVGDRLATALSLANADVGVVVYGDGPFPDPVLVDEFVRLFYDQECDMVCNDLITTYPAGYEVEVFRVSALRDALAQTTDPVIREHGTLCIRQNPGRYRIRKIEAPEALRRPDIHVEVDTEEDLRMIRALYEGLAQAHSHFGIREVIGYVDTHPEVLSLNRDVPRRWTAFREGDT